MKKVFLTFAILTGVLLSFKAFADVASLPVRGLKSTDMIQVYDNLGKSYGVNWSDLVRMQVQATNWNSITLSTGATNWAIGGTGYIGN